MTRDLKERARDLANKHFDVAVALTNAAAGYPDRLLKAPWRGSLDNDIARLVTDIRKDQEAA